MILKILLTFKFCFLVNVTIYTNIMNYNIHGSLILVYKRGETGITWWSSD